jgi:hypothetical protein
MNKNSTAREEELEQHVMVGEMVMSQDDVDSQTLSILVYVFPRMSYTISSPYVSLFVYLRV